MSNKEVPVTYNGIMVGVAEVVENADNEIGMVLNVRLNEESVIKPFFIDHTMPSISIMDEPIDIEEHAYYPEPYCERTDDCDKPAGHIQACAPKH